MKKYDFFFLSHVYSVLPYKFTYHYNMFTLGQSNGVVCAL